MVFDRLMLPAVFALACATFVIVDSAPAAAACPAGYYQCVKGGKANSPHRCCPGNAKRVGAPIPSPAPRAVPLSKCKTAVREVGANGSVKIRCTSYR